MPILAVPYLLPFAEAAGIAIAGLGLMELSKQVQKFMDVNPEETFQILKMIMPQEGIAAMFEQLFNERGDDDELDEKEAVKEREEEGEFEEEVKDTRSKKEIVLDAIRKAKQGKGNYSSEDAEGPAVSGRGNVIRGLEDAGKVDKGLKDKPYKKSKFNYKKYFRKADGGIMDVL
tara:strand:+ start:304 stop:825 length:522 start_codon:yes stop_codon:yes gene_type:complete